MLEIKRILCPIDFSEFSVRAYHHALSLAEHYRAKLVPQHIVELWRYPCAQFAASLANYEEFCRALREGGKEQLQEFVRNHTHDEIRPELVVEEGIAADSILSSSWERTVGEPWASQRRSDLLELLGRLNPRIAKLSERVEEEAGKCPEAQRLTTYPGVGPLTALAFVLIIGQAERFRCGN
ncbi:MAG: universal stress protein [Candidatus Sulfotelmatobacter sp.]